MSTTTADHVLLFLGSQGLLGQLLDQQPPHQLPQLASTNNADSEVLGVEVGKVGKSFTGASSLASFLLQVRVILTPWYLGQTESTTQIFHEDEVDSWAEIPVGYNHNGIPSATNLTRKGQITTRKFIWQKKEVGKK